MMIFLVLYVALGLTSGRIVHHYWWPNHHYNPDTRLGLGFLTWGAFILWPAAGVFGLGLMLNWLMTARPKQALPFAPRDLMLEKKPE